MKKVIVISVIICSQLLFKGLAGQLFAQVLSNFGSIIYSANDTIFTNGGVHNSTDGLGSGNIGGTFRNSGYLYIKNSGTDNGDWINDGNNAAFANTAGVLGASAITCVLIGGNQNITTTSTNSNNNITEFHNLILQGTGVKQLLYVDAIVHDTLNLNDRELATDVNKLFVTNTDPAAIQLTSGFVSSLDGGWLERNAASTSTYLFPVGSTAGTSRYRPVEITPDNSLPGSYAVRLANVNPGIEAYPVSVKQATISSVNNLYYHQITRESGNSPASITVYYDPAMDGPVTGLGHWQGKPQWEDIVSSPDLSNYNLSATTKVSWDFSKTSEAFALMKLINECGEMFIPTAFSPDGNGENDMECIYGKCIKSIYFAIYDRWGEKVFETTSQSNCWDGTFRGKEMNTAVFVYYMKATLTTGEEISKKGNISLLR